MIAETELACPTEERLADALAWVEVRIDYTLGGEWSAEYQREVMREIRDERRRVLEEVGRDA